MLDADAFAALYDREVSDVTIFIARRTLDAELALDLTAETFAQAWHASRRFRDLADGSGAPWLFGIARNLLRHYKDERWLAPVKDSRKLVVTPAGRVAFASVFDIDTTSI